MKKLFAVVILAALFIGGYCGDYTPNELIIKTSQPHLISRSTLGLASLDSYLADKSVVAIESIDGKETSQYFVVRLSEPVNWQELGQLQFEGVEYIEPNYLSEFLIYPNDPLLYEQYYDLVNIPAAWNMTTGREDILVAVVDSGTHFDHPDLQQNLYINQGEISVELIAELDENQDGRITIQEIKGYFIEHNYDLDEDGEITHLDILAANSPLINEIDDDDNGYIDDIWGWDFTDAIELANIASGDYLHQDNNPEDEYNHGTHVAGIVGATANNQEGGSGICWNVSILTIRAGFKTADGLSGVLQDDDAAAGIIYAADMGAEIINLSWGDNVYAAIIADACEYAYNLGSIIVVSAGNTAAAGLMYPARLAHTISVGAVDDQGERFWQSSYGEYLDLMAPGVNVLSCFDIEENLYAQMSGTSMSAPYISGAIALLLSHEPDLGFEEVRSRLVNSAVDLGEPGRDDYYGYGLLDAESLLQISSTPLIEVLFPQDNLGISSSLSIIGTVTASDFAKYSVMFTDEANPGALDWLSVEYPHGNSPHWNYEEVIADELTWFDIPGQDGEFTVKIEVVTVSNQHYDYKFALHIDQSPPQLIENVTAIQTRYYGENLVNYLTLKYNEPVEIQARLLRENQEECLLFSNSTDSLHFLNIPILQEPGDYGAEIIATNICGLSDTTQLAENLLVRRHCLDFSSWQSSVIGEPLVCINKAISFESDDVQNDILGMHLDEELNRTISIWEDNGNSLQQKQIITGFSTNFWIHSIGNCSDQEFEVVGVEANTAAVYRVNGDQATSIWTLNNSYGGSFIDYNADGVDDLALVQNVTIGNVTYRVLGLHKKYGNSWQTQHLIYNNTATYSKNEFLNQVECADLDNDGYPEIITADNDGDIILYEQPSESEPFAAIYNYRLPAANADYLTSGHLRNPDEIDFCVGCWNYDSKSSAKTFSCFVIFASEGNNSYTPLDTLYFDEYQENNGITCSDLDGDGDEELILALDPNLYIVDYVDTDGDQEKDSFLPIWKGFSNQHYPKSLAAVPAHEDISGRIIANAEINGERRLNYLKPLENYTGPPPVEGFQLQVINQNTVNISWLINSQTPLYRIYRKAFEQEDWQEVMICETGSDNYLDTGLLEGITWNYRITSFSDQYQPSESLPTYWQSVTPDFPPELIEPVTMISPWNLTLIFDQNLSNTVINTGHYKVDQGVGRPSSVNLIRQKKGVLLSFHEAIPYQTSYDLEISGLQSESGIFIPDTVLPFVWKEDTSGPCIVSSEVEGNQTVIITFNEVLSEDGIFDVSNYHLTNPQADKSNYITSVVHEAEKITLEFAHSLVASNQLYYLRISGISDLTGNRISNCGNKTYFTLTDRSLKNMVAYPNPFKTERYPEFRFASLPLGEKGEVWIYDLTGDLVFHASFAPRTVLENYFSWNGKNSSGNRVSSGLYFYILQIGGSSKRGKIAVIN